MEIPKVFVSYSHDSDEHKKWVLQLSTKLRQNGIDVTLDRWDLGAGDDMTLFMEKGVRDSDRVLVICTDAYVRKADAGEGGVGYERLIITAQLVRDVGTPKFIPIIRQSSDTNKTPTFLETRIYIDFTDEDEFDEKFDDLLQEISNVRHHQKPSLGKNPYTNQSDIQEDPSHHLPEIPEQINSASQAHESAFQLARANDILGWRRLVRRIRPDVFDSLLEWRQKELDGNWPESAEQRRETVDKAVDIISPLISVALVGIESQSERFNNQKSLLDEMLKIRSREGWDRSGYEKWMDIPDTLSYVYHSLHGSLSIYTDQLTLALDLARVKTRKTPNSDLIDSVWKNSQLMGWSEPLGGTCTENWQYLGAAYDRWEWLSLIFEDASTYRISLVAYYMALSIHELAAKIASTSQNGLGGQYGIGYNVPLDFLSEDSKIVQEATDLLLRNPTRVELWTSLDVTLEQIKSARGNWIQECRSWLRQVYQNRHFPHVKFLLEDFLDAL
jgi:hypothetical protein